IDQRVRNWRRVGNDGVRNDVEPHDDVSDRQSWRRVGRRDADILRGSLPQIDRLADLELGEVNDHIITLGHMYREVASGNSRGTTGNRPRRVQEIGVHGDDRPGRLGSGWSDEFQVPGLGRPGVQYPEAVFAPCDVEYWLNLAVDHPF